MRGGSTHHSINEGYRRRRNHTLKEIRIDNPLARSSGRPHLHNQLEEDRVTPTHRHLLGVLQRGYENHVVEQEYEQISWMKAKLWRRLREHLRFWVTRDLRRRRWWKVRAAGRARVFSSPRICKPRFIIYGTTLVTATSNTGVDLPG